MKYKPGDQVILYEKKKPSFLLSIMIGLSVFFIADMGVQRETVSKLYQTPPENRVEINLLPVVQDKKEEKVVLGDIDTTRSAKKNIPYVERFKTVAINEYRKYGIPASITLAQGILESDYGRGRLTLATNNHFGIKCKGEKASSLCYSWEDDDPEDTFRMYDKAWDSYRDHSLLLTVDGVKRYGHLRKYGKDYKRWAHGLKKAGYATDPEYGSKLIRLIEKYKLYEYDSYN